jgi:hypothetical protein
MSPILTVVLMNNFHALKEKLKCVFSYGYTEFPNDFWGVGVSTYLWRQHSRNTTCKHAYTFVTYWRQVVCVCVCVCVHIYIYIYVSLGCKWLLDLQEIRRRQLRPLSPPRTT